MTRRTGHGHGRGHGHGKTETALPPAAALLFLVLGACSQPPPPPAPASAAKVEVKSEVYEAPKRLVSFGDVHGDLEATRKALKLAGAIDDKDEWIGGDLFVVQVGDQLDRGDDDKAIMDLFDKLRDKAKAAGGTFIALNGNHEFLNVMFDFRYATPGSFAPFAGIITEDKAVKGLPPSHRSRAAAFMPGGPYARMLAEQPFFAIVGDTVFVHGGITKQHLDYGLDKLQRETKDWLEGKAKNPPALMLDPEAPVWTRKYSDKSTGKDDCDELAKVLDALGKKRMVMGHTPQLKGVSFACDKRAIRVDVGMSRGMNAAPVEVIEIVGDEVKVLKE